MNDVKDFCLKNVYSVAVENLKSLSDAAISKIVEDGVVGDKSLEARMSGEFDSIINDRGVCRILGINYGFPSERDFLKAYYVAFLAASGKLSDEKGF
jgi:hypothetical protein